MYEGEITHTIVMTFKDAEENIRNIKVPFARANVTGKEVRKVMEYIVADGVFLSHKGLPLVKLVKATLVTVRMIFSAVKGTSRPGSSAAAKSAVSEVPTGSPTNVQSAVSNVPPGCPTSNVQTTGSDVPTGCPTTIARLPRATVPRPVGADENNLARAPEGSVFYIIPEGEGDRAQHGGGAPGGPSTYQHSVLSKECSYPSKGFACGKSYPIMKGATLWQ